MISEGATTLWERWEKITPGGMNSHNHIMLGSVDAWFYRVIAGISCLEPAWKKIRIKPSVFSDLKYATATLKTMRGKVHVSLDKKEHNLNLIVQIPVGTTAEIHLPLPLGHGMVQEKGRLIWKKGEVKVNFSDVSFSELTEKYLIFKIRSGDYSFQVKI